MNRRDFFKNISGVALSNVMIGSESNNIIPINLSSAPYQEFPAVTGLDFVERYWETGLPTDDWIYGCNIFYYYKNSLILNS